MQGAKACKYYTIELCRCKDLLLHYFGRVASGRELPNLHLGWVQQLELPLDRAGYLRSAKRAQQHKQVGYVWVLTL